MANYSTRNPYRDISRRPPVKRTSVGDGTEVVEKLSPLGLKMKVVDANGVVASLALSNGGMIRTMQQSPYGVLKLAEKQKKGFIAYKDCPVRLGAMAMPKSWKPCDGGTDDQCCEHMTALIEARKAAAGKRSAEFAEKFKSGQEQMAQAMLETARALNKAERPAGGIFGRGVKADDDE